MNLITPDFGTIFWQIITFVFVMIILRKFAWKGIMTSISEREQKVHGAIESAKEAKKQLELLQEKGKEILDKANLESEMIIKEALSIKEKIVRESRDEAKIQGEVLINKAKNTIQQEKEIAITEIKTQVSGMIISATERILTKKLGDEKEQQKFLEDALGSEDFMNLSDKSQ